jgi:transposase
MPWKERSIVEERMRFVLRLKDGESMASLCREFGVSRVTGYKIYERYQECGLEGLTDRARTPYRYANKLPAQLEAMIVSMRRQKPTWGARKLRDRLLRKLPNHVRVPAQARHHDRAYPARPSSTERSPRTHASNPKNGSYPSGRFQLLQQQAKFDAFVQEFNNERPHEALDMQYPADVYQPSARPYRGIGELSYPFHDRTALVTCCGRICIYKKKINLSTSLAGQAVGIKEVDDGIWLVSFMDYDLGYIDLEEKTLQPLNNPFGPRV